MASLTIDAVGKSFGEEVVLSGISLTVKDGEFLVLVGPSGCGKSTLLRLIAGLEDLSEGSIVLGTRNVSHVDPKDRNVAMVFQNYALYPHMTVFENMAFGLQQRKMPKKEIASIVNEIAHTLDLHKFLNRRPNELSGGQQQRVAMGRAIVRSPAIYLMDEPLSSLDAKLRVQMRSELKLLRERLGVTTIYVTHDQVEAMTLGDRVVVLSPHSPTRDSNLQQCDTPQKLYLEPRNMFVAGFIGSPAMNFIYLDLETKGQGLLGRIPDANIALHLTSGNTLNLESLKKYADKRVIMGIRPEFFALDPITGAGINQSIDVDVLVSELVGPDVFLHFDLPTPTVGGNLMEILNDGENTRTSRARYVARTSSERLTQKAGEMELFLDIQRLHFFDERTTDRII